MNIVAPEKQLGTPNDLNTVSINDLDNGVLKYGLSTDDYIALKEFYRSTSGAGIKDPQQMTDLEMLSKVALTRKGIGVGYYSDFDMNNLEFSQESIEEIAKKTKSQFVIKVMENGVVRLFSPHYVKTLFYNALAERYGRDKGIKIIEDGLTVYNLSTQPK